MKKKLFYITTLLLSAAVLSLSSCLKDNRNVDFSKATPVVDFNYGGLSNFGKDAVTESTDTVVRQIAVQVTTAAVPTTATTITLGVDNAVVTSYVAANPSVTFLPFPTGTYVAPTTVTIPAGKRSAVITVTLYKGLLDPSKSYMLPLKITGTTGGYTISGNMAIHYFHVIGNDFAGTWRQTFRRWSGATDSLTAANLYGGSFAGQPATFVPVSPTEFVVFTGYDGGNAIHYDVSFTKNSDGTYSNFAVQLLPADVASVAGVIAFPQAPVFQATPGGPGVSSSIAGPLTYANALKIFNFQFIAQTSAARYIVDSFYK